MRKAAVVAILLTLVCAGAASAQAYSFSVPRMQLAVYPNPDASLSMEYTIEFACTPGAHPVDIVDMGLPHKGYDIGNMSATIDGYPITGIAKSTEIGIGVEVPLGQHAIQPGQSGTLQFKCTMPKMVYQDTGKHAEPYASLQFLTTYWGAEYVQGSAEIQAVVYLPKEIKPEEILHQGDPFTSKGGTDTHTFAAWVLPSASAAQGHEFKLSFPRRIMTTVVPQTVLDLFYKWWVDNPVARVVWAVVVFVLLGVAFFRATQGTGCSVFVAMLGFGSVGFVVWPWLELLAVPILIPLWFLSEKALKRRKGKYLPAIASVEGGGIKRGLAAPEAAIILELPLNRVLTLVLFGMLKKGILHQVEAEPLEAVVNPEYTGLGRKDRRKKARSLGTVIRGYEQEFIEVIEESPGLPFNRLDFAKAMKQAVEITAKRLKNFDLKRTQSYYRFIVSRAWSEAKALGDVEQRTQHCDDNLLWMLAAPNGYDNFGYWHTRGYHYHTPWIRSGGLGAATTPQTPVGGKTSFTDVSQSFAGWAEGVTGSLAGKMDAGSIGLKSDGLVNLKGVDKVTMDTLSSLAKSSGSGGGGGGCACAGCACACACAGGGR